jgi:hypothetical protein
MLGGSDDFEQEEQEVRSFFQKNSPYVFTIW